MRRRTDAGRVACGHDHDLWRRDASRHAAGVTAFQLGGALGVAIVSTVAVSRSADDLAANEGANPLVVLTEGFQSAFVACVVLAAIGLALR